MLQRCTNCLEVKLLTEYYPKKKGGHEIRTECKDCMKKKARDVYKKRKMHKLITKLVEVEPPMIHRDRLLLKMAITGAICLLIMGFAVSLLLRG